MVWRYAIVSRKSIHEISFFTLQETTHVGKNITMKIKIFLQWHREDEEIDI
jgi:hypothetical protein